MTMKDERKIENMKNADDELKLLENCNLCGRSCGVNRLKDELGQCKSGALPKIYRYGVHYGEEPPISGTKGSGTIFFTGCSLECVYCQNHPWSQDSAGDEIEISDLAMIMLNLQDDGVHNINLVTPTHFVPQIVTAIKAARKDGLNIPIVYNTSGYESQDALNLLNGYVDIYLVDVKYADKSLSEKFSNCPNYPEVNKKALTTMFQQVGYLKMDEDEIATEGIIIRHLILPGYKIDSKKVLNTIREICGTEVHISLMSQYIPLHKALEEKELNRELTSDELDDVIDYFCELGFANGWIQELDEDTDPDLIGENMDEMM